MKKIAVFSDVHGNVHAFRAMVADAKQQGFDDSWFIGDLLMPGPGVEEILDLLEQMHPSVIVRGNWDDLVVRGVRGEMDLEKPSHVYFARLAQYVAGHLTKDQVDTIANWPLHQTVQAGAFRFGLSHNLPELNMGQDLFPTNSSEKFDQLFDDDQIDIAIYAHVHHALLRYASDERVVLNPGSVGEPFNGWDRLQKDTRAHYLMLTVDDQGVEDLDFRHVAYDRQAEYELAKQADIPYLYLYQRTLQTGWVDTHNQALVDEQNRKFGYADQYREYCQQLSYKK